MATKTSHTDANTTIKELKEIVAQFATERNWTNNDPKQLLISAFIELGELAEHYQWSADGNWKESKDEKKQIAFELVDVFFYLLRFINKSDLDFSHNFYQKVAKLAKKYPPTQTRAEYQKTKESYRLSGKNKLYD